MKNTSLRKHLVVPLFVALFGIGHVVHAASHAATGTEAPPPAEAQSELEEFDEFEETDRSEAVEWARESLDALDERIDATQAWLDENWEKLDQAARERGRKTMAALREQRSELADWFSRLRGGSAETWEEVKDGFSSAYERLQATWERSKAVIADGESDEDGAAGDAEGADEAEEAGSAASDEAAEPTR